MRLDPEGGNRQEGSSEMRQMPDLSSLPTMLDAFLQPWVSAIESTGLGMGSIIADAAVSTSLSLDRRVIYGHNLRRLGGGSECI